MDSSLLDLRAKGGNQDQPPRLPDFEDVAIGLTTRGGVFGAGCDFGAGITRIPASLRLPEKSGMG
jgi:hypothetical protein